MAKKKSTIHRKIAGRTYAVAVPAHVAADGELIIKGKDLVAAELSIAAAIAAEGPVLGETFSWMRRAVGLQAKHLAELLDVRPESVSRWERGERPMDRAAWLLLAKLVLDKAGKRMPALELMSRIAANTQPPRQVTVPLVSSGH
ncbi:MAG: helix-turn-helix domain-containing protein [Deltaproteobacteria bacterium]|nr:helix-turn-helix domain-containing protein [Deltaproteobacteria bacterium]